MIREKKELSNQLDVKTLTSMNNNKFIIKEVKDVNTKFGVKPRIELVQGSKPYSLFLNQKAENNLIDCFGKDDRLWLDKEVQLSTYTDEYYNKTCIFVDKVRPEVIPEQLVRESC